MKPASPAKVPKDIKNTSVVLLRALTNRAEPAWRVMTSLFPQLSASLSYIDRFRGAPSHEVPRLIPRRPLRDARAVTFGAALMEALLWSSAEAHNRQRNVRKAPNVKRSQRVLQMVNVATERSISIHAAFIERMVQTNQPDVFVAAQYNYAALVRSQITCVHLQGGYMRYFGGRSCQEWRVEIVRVCIDL